MPIEAIGEWYASGEAARALGVSVVHVNRLIHEGQLRALRTRLGYLIEPDSVAELAEQRRRRLEAKLAC